MFGHFKFTSKQKEIIKECISKNKQEYDKWYFYNLWYPIGIIIISLILVAITKQDFKPLTDKLLEGTLSLLGINVLFAMSSYLLRIKTYKQDEMRNDVVNLSTKLSDWKTILIVVGTILFILPSLYQPTGWLGNTILLIIAILILSLSINTSLKIFMIRDEFYKKAFNLEETSFESKIRTEGDKKHGKTW